MISALTVFSAAFLTLTNHYLLPDEELLLLDRDELALLLDRDELPEEKDPDERLDEEPVLMLPLERLDDEPTPTDELRLEEPLL